MPYQCLAHNLEIEADLSTVFRAIAETPPMAGAKNQPQARLAGNAAAISIPTEATLPKLVSADEDFHAWLLQQADAMRNTRPEGIDWPNLAEELDSMARAERRELRSRLRVLLSHLLKWRYQAKRRSRSWEGTIVEQRFELRDLLADEPSLNGYLAETIEKAYELACVLAGREMGLSRAEWKALFPHECPWPFDELANEDFWPETKNRKTSAKIRK